MSEAPHSFSPESLSAHTEWLRRLARSLERDEHAAEDAVQETYAAALASRPEARASLRPWLASVLHHLLARDHRRRRRAGSRERANAREERLPSTAEALLELELHERLLRAVRELEEPHRTVIVLRFFEGLPPREIARRCGIAPGAARTRLSRALDRLRERLGVAPQRSSFERWILLPGGIWMSAKSIGAVAATLAILSGVAWWVLRDTGIAEPTEPRITGEENLSSRGSGGGELRASADAPHVARAEDAAPVATGPASTSETSVAPRDLVVRVVDGAGRALPDFPLALQGYFPDGGSTAVETFDTTFADGEGQCVFAKIADRCAALRAQRPRRPGPLPLDARIAARENAAPMWEVVPAGIALAEPRLWFDPLALPVEPRVLVIPGAGSLRVRFTGSFPAAGLVLDVRTLPGTTPETSRRWSTRDAARFTTGEPEMHWPYVALEQLVQIKATPEDGSAPASSVVVLGPRTPGDQAFATLELEEPYPAIIGRVLTAEGNALSDARLAARVRKQREGQLFRVGGIAVLDPPSEAKPFATDARGAFRVPISDPGPFEVDAWLHFEVLPSPSAPEAAVGSIAEWLLPQPLAPGMHDAGALFLRENPLLAAGIVTGPGATPLAGVRIVPSLQSEDPLGTSMTWFAVESLATTSDKQGRFEVRGVLETSLVRLTPSRSGFAALEEPEVARGARDVRIQLVAGAQVAGRVTLPSGLTGAEVEVRLHRGSKTLARTAIKGSGRFRFEDVSTALCDIRVWTPQGNRLLCTVADVEPWHEGSGDPRLAGIELGREWRGVPVRILDAERMPCLETHLHVAPLGLEGSNEFYAQTSREGRIALVVPAAASRVYLSEARHAGTILDCRDTEQEVVLAPAIRLCIELDAEGIEALKTERLALVLDLDPAAAGELAEAHISPYVHVAEDGLACVELPLAGRYLVRWMRSTASGPIRAYQTASDITPEFIEVEGGRGEQRVKLATPGGAQVKRKRRRFAIGNEAALQREDHTQARRSVRAVQRAAADCGGSGRSADSRAPSC